MLLGPHSPIPLLTAHISELQAVGEIGVMLLLFAVALDIEPTRLWSMRRLVLGLGGGTPWTHRRHRRKAPKTASS